MISIRIAWARFRFELQGSIPIRIDSNSNCLGLFSIRIGFNSNCQGPISIRISQLQLEMHRFKRAAKATLRNEADTLPQPSVHRACIQDIFRNTINTERNWSNSQRGMKAIRLPTPGCLSVIWHMHVIIQRADTAGVSLSGSPRANHTRTRTNKWPPIRIQNKTKNVPGTSAKRNKPDVEAVGVEQLSRATHSLHVVEGAAGSGISP